MFTFAIFGSNHIDGSALYAGETVVGLSLFGGLIFDFASFPPPPDVHVVIVSIFGGATVKILPQAEVEMSGLSIFGGRSLESSRSTPNQPESREPPPLLGLSAYCLFGGVSVKRTAPATA